MEWPKTVQEAVRRLVDEIPKEGIDRISAMTEEAELYELHHGLGRSIRNTMGLWQANNALLADCKRVAVENGQTLTEVFDSSMLIHPDDASHAILVELWKKLSACGGPEFKRELKYEVTKLDDIEKYLTERDQAAYSRLIRAIQDGRVADGKVACPDYVVVNEVEDYAEQVWALIEDGERRKALKAEPDPDRAEVPE